jgi:hypothetical protein
MGNKNVLKATRFIGDTLFLEVEPDNTIIDQTTYSHNYATLSIHSLTDQDLALLEKIIRARRIEMLDE